MATKKPKKPKKRRMTVDDVQMVKADGVLRGTVKRGGKKYLTIMIPLDGVKEAEVKES